MKEGNEGWVEGIEGRKKEGRSEGRERRKGRRDRRRED